MHTLLFISHEPPLHAGATLMLSSIQLTIMLASLVFYCPWASCCRSEFSVTATFLMSTLPALLALLISEVKNYSKARCAVLVSFSHLVARTNNFSCQLVAPTTMSIWMFSFAMVVWINSCLLRDSKRVILGDGITNAMPAAVHLHGFVLQRFLGQVLFLLFKPKEDLVEIFTNK